MRSLLYTCRGHKHCVSMSPAGPLEPHLALPNRVLVGGPYGVLLPPRPTMLGLIEAAACFDYYSIFAASISPIGCGLSCGCDFALRSEAAGCSCAQFPAGLRLGAGAPLRVTRRAIFRCKGKRFHHSKFMSRAWFFPFIQLKNKHVK